ncbi:MAG: beta-galactosidase, partial [Frankiales bacterium]|nr:beta-galactosidase [Frankiales bacterium]
MNVVGAQYYRPPNPAPDQWADDLASMAAHGMNTVKFWACWSWINTEDGVYGWDELDTLLDLAERNGLSVVINVILENVPYWLGAAHPDARYVDSQGQAVHLTAAMNTPGGGWPGLCFDNEEVWRSAERFVTALVRHYAAHPALAYWDVWNEPHLEPASYFPDRLYCYCDASVTGFRQWLQGKYVDLSALNAAWSRRFSAWEQVEPPRLFEAVPDMIDWRTFWFDNLSSWLERRVIAVRSLDEATPVMTHVALSGYTGQLATHTLDEFALGRTADVFGTSSFPTWLMNDDHVEHLFNLDTAASAADGRPFWQAELQGGKGRRHGFRSTGQPRPDTVRLWMWNALACGASGVMFWQWRPELLGPESPGYGLCLPDGRASRRTEAAAELAQIVTHPALQGLTYDRPSIGLVVSRRSALHAFATDRDMDVYQAAVLGAYRILMDEDRAVLILSDDRIEADGVPAPVKTVLWPMPSVGSAAMGEQLRKFVDGGGRLVAEAAPGEYSGLGYRSPTVPGSGMDTLFGVLERESDVVDDLSISLEGGASLEGGWQREEIDLRGASALGWFSDGAVAVTAHRLGRGAAVLIGSNPSISYHRTHSPEARAAYAQILTLGGSLATWTWTDPRPGLVSRSATTPSHGRAVFA